MRDSRINQTRLWRVSITGSIPTTDLDGNLTGEETVTYSTPTEIRLSIYPSTVAFKNKLFGSDVQCDMIATSVAVELSQDDLLFDELPTGDYESKQTYKVTKISKSLNAYSYALERCV